MFQLKNNLVYNYEQWPELFKMTEQELLEAMDAHQEYNKNPSMNDWARMYAGIHRESSYEASRRGWLAAIRWMREQQVNQASETYINSIADGTVPLDAGMILSKEEKERLFGKQDTI